MAFHNLQFTSGIMELFSFIGLFNVGSFHSHLSCFKAQSSKFYTLTHSLNVMFCHNSKFLTLIARKCPYMDRFINVHSSVSFNLFIASN